MFEAEPTFAVPTLSDGFVRTGTVEEVIDDTGHARIRLDNAPHEPDLRAEIATWGDGVPATGDRVVLAVQGSGESFVIGVLERRDRRIDRRITLSDGAVVRISGDPPAEKLALAAPDRQLLVEYDTATGRMKVNVPAGDLELATDEGDIVLNAARSLRLLGRSIEATGGSHVHLATEDLPGMARSVLSLDPSVARIASPNLAVAAQRARLRLGEATYSGDRLSARITSLKLVAQRLERIADQVHERVGYAYTTVRKLLEVRAKRIRTVVSSSYRLRTKTAFLKSDDDFKVKGDKIHLG